MTTRAERQVANKERGVLCQVADCENGVDECGLCPYHRQQEVEARRAALGRTCSEPDCQGGLVARGLCRKHYGALWARERRQQQRSGVVGR